MPDNPKSRPAVVLTGLLETMVDSSQRLAPLTLQCAGFFFVGAYGARLLRKTFYTFAPVDPVLFRFESSQHAGWFAVTRTS